MEEDDRTFSYANIGRLSPFSRPRHSVCVCVCVCVLERARVCVCVTIVKIHTVNFDRQASVCREVLVLLDRRPRRNVLFAQTARTNLRFASFFLFLFSFFFFFCSFLSFFLSCHSRYSTTNVAGCEANVHQSVSTCSYLRYFSEYLAANGGEETTEQTKEESETTERGAAGEGTRKARERKSDTRREERARTDRRCMREEEEQGPL